MSQFFVSPNFLEPRNPHCWLAWPVAADPESGRALLAAEVTEATVVRHPEFAGFGGDNVILSCWNAQDRGEHLTAPPRAAVITFNGAHFVCEGYAGSIVVFKTLLLLPKKSIRLVA